MALANRVAQPALQKPQRKLEKIGAMVKCGWGHAPSSTPPATQGKLAEAAFSSMPIHGTAGFLASATKTLRPALRSLTSTHP